MTIDAPLKISEMFEKIGAWATVWIFFSWLASKIYFLKVAMKPIMMKMKTNSMEGLVLPIKRIIPINWMNPKAKV